MIELYCFCIIAEVKLFYILGVIDFWEQLVICLNISFYVRKSLLRLIIITSQIKVQSALEFQKFLVWSLIAVKYVEFLKFERTTANPESDLRKL